MILVRPHPAITDPRRVLDQGFEIHESSVNGERIGAIARRRIAGRS